MRDLLTAIFHALRPLAPVGVRARSSLRRRLVARLEGQRPKGVSAHALALVPDGPVIERELALPAAELRLPNGSDHRWESRSIHRLGEVLIHAPTGLVLVGGAVLHQSGGVAPDKRPKAQKSFLVEELAAASRWRRLTAPPMLGPVHPIGEVPRGNYYHWLIETLPRILAVHRHDPTVTVVGEHLPAFAVDALDVLGIRFLATQAHVRAQELLVVDVPESDWPHPEDIDRLAQVGRDAVDRTGRRGQDRFVYVSRRDSQRGLAMEEALEEHLASRGFIIFRADRCATWVDQVAAFSGAELVIGMHGAGLSNAVFLPKGSQVIELQPVAYSASMFQNLCAARGLEHTAVALPVEGEGSRFGSAATARELLDPILASR